MTISQDAARSEVRERDTLAARDAAVRRTRRIVPASPRAPSPSRARVRRGGPCVQGSYDARRRPDDARRSRRRPWTCRALRASPRSTASPRRSSRRRSPRPRRGPSRRRRPRPSRRCPAARERHHHLLELAGARDHGRPWSSSAHGAHDDARAARRGRAGGDRRRLQPVPRRLRADGVNAARGRPLRVASAVLLDALERRAARRGAHGRAGRPDRRRRARALGLRPRLRRGPGLARPPAARRSRAGLAASSSSIARRGPSACRPGCRLDLGATAKALAADRAARRALAAAPAAGVLVNLGGDIATAGPAAGRRLAGARHRRPPRRARRRPGRRLDARAGGAGDVEHRRAPLAPARRRRRITSSTRAPASPPRRPGAPCRVAAASCVDANTASTAAIVRGATAPRMARSRSACPRGSSTAAGAVVHDRRLAERHGGMIAAAGPRRALVPDPRDRRGHARPAHGERRPRHRCRSLRWRSGRARRASSSTALHRNVSLLVVVLLAVHVLTAVLDPFAPSALARRRRPARSAVPAALARARRARASTCSSRSSSRACCARGSGCAPGGRCTGSRTPAGRSRCCTASGTGTDARTPWLQALTRALRGAPSLGGRRVAARERLAGREPRAPRPRRSGSAVALAACIAFWPSRVRSQPGWARRAGTPAALLGVRAGARSAAAAQRRTSAPSPSRSPFAAALAGRARERGIATGAVVAASPCG